MSSFNTKMSMIKTRWNAAPTWVKVVDVVCWVSLIGFIIYTIIK